MSSVALLSIINFYSGTQLKLVVINRVLILLIAIISLHLVIDLL
jgi:hypothetical protein